MGLKANRVKRAQCKFGGKLTAFFVANVGSSKSYYSFDRFCEFFRPNLIDFNKFHVEDESWIWGNASGNTFGAVTHILERE